MDISVVQMRFLFYFFVVLLIWINGSVLEVMCEPDLMTRMKLVKDKILKDYDKYIRPTNGTNTTEIHTVFIPRQIVELDEDLALFTMDSFLFSNWLDTRLRWNVSDYDGLLQFPASLVWVPDISVYNSHSLHLDPTKDVYLGLHSSGWIWWSPPILTQTTCPSVSQTPYPNDEVECEIILGTWMHNGWEVDYQHSHEIYMDFFENINPRWELITSKSRTYRNETYYSCCPEPYISIHIVLAMKRRPVAAIEATRSSCILVMILTLSIFWMPPDSSKKLLLGGFLFLVLNVLLVYVGWSTKGPLLVLFAVSFLQTTMYLLVTTILLQVFIVIKIASQYGPSRPPPILIHFLTGPLGKYACLRSPTSADKLSLDRVQLKEDSSTGESLSAKDEWMLLAAASDRVLFVVMAVVMIAVHHL